jgi:hypothetical protein
MPDTARFRADFTFCVVKTGLAGWGGRILTFAFQNRSSPRLSHVLARDDIHYGLLQVIDTYRAAAVAQPIEHRQPLVVASDGLSVRSGRSAP